MLQWTEGGKFQKPARKDGTFGPSRKQSARKPRPVVEGFLWKCPSRRRFMEGCPERQSTARWRLHTRKRRDLSRGASTEVDHRLAQREVWLCFFLLWEGRLALVRGVNGLERGTKKKREISREVTRGASLRGGKENYVAGWN